MNLPNWITLSRLLGLPIVVYCLYSDRQNERWIGFGVFLLAAATDWLDGYLARKLNQVTALGKFLDPLVDKLLVLIPLLIAIDLHLAPAVGVCLILTRELTIAGWRVGKAQISGANIWGKLKTVSQIVAIAILIAPVANVPSGVSHNPGGDLPFLAAETFAARATATAIANWQLYGLVAFWLSVVLTLVSGLIYLLPNGTDAVDN